MPGDTLATVKLQNPFSSVVKEVAVMRHRHHRAGEAVQVVFEPLNAFRVKVVCRFVKQQHIRAREQQTAQRHTAFFTAGKHTDFGVPGRQTQSVSRNFHLCFHIGAGRGNDCLQTGLLGSKRIKVGIGFGIGGIHGIEFCLRLNHLSHSLLNCLTDSLFGIELRLLRQIPDIETGHRNGFAFNIRIHTGHDFEQCGLPGPVQTEHTDLCTGEKGETDILENLTFRGHDFAHAIHRKNVLSHT